MPPIASSKLHSSTCAHAILTFSPSVHASKAGYTRPTPNQRATAAGLKKGQLVSESAFPAPLVLPNDDLAYDPKWPAQSLRSWIREKDRNEVTPQRRTIYIASPPEITPEVRNHVATFSAPLRPQHAGSEPRTVVPNPGVQDLVDYLAAFFHGLPVKRLSSATMSLRFTTWDDHDQRSSPRRQKKASTKPSHIALATGTEAIRIRARPCPDGAFPHQLNLNDLLDVVISILPEDAYALLLLVEQDIYEDERDDFCCGRAYGGSRCAVVSMARYNPTVAEGQGIISLDDRSQQQQQQQDHACWPASHCEEYVNACCNAESIEEEEEMAIDGAKLRQPPKTASKPLQIVDGPSSSSFRSHSSLQLSHTPLHGALKAYMNPPRPRTPESYTSLWLSHVARTASHELGHCFGIDHCVYYACVMQGTASMAEDGRQPPYLCPVDLAKIRRAIGGKESVGGASGHGKGAGGASLHLGDWERDRYEALLRFCERKDEVGLWRAFGGWLRGRLQEAVDNDKK
ncbi:MAG: hypothetical protein Q9163_006025 [Psora crenata]